MTAINNVNTHIITKTFKYHKPETVEEALKLLSELNDVKLMAGGTDLIPKMKQRLLEPSNIVSLKYIPELEGIREEGDWIFIGAATSLRDVERSTIIQRKLPLLQQCVKSIGSVQIRNMGTLGGNVCNASPAADGALGLITLDALAIISGSNGDTEIKVSEFFTAPGVIVLKEEELVKEFKIKVPNNNTGSSFISIGRTSLDISTISIGVVLETRDDEVIDVKLGVGSVAPTPLRIYDVEDWLIGKKLGPDVIRETAKRVSSGIKPITDIRGTSEYRYAAAEGIAIEAITRAWKREEME
ncbi:xanthine dehydrogenase family protein subunit M [Candidatus Bathyarchaeota archaeon]|nr:xanthine dehydrogenase family protein subunit M [Candidatus Bathyarchaeota archaeon]